MSLLPQCRADTQVSPNLSTPAFLVEVLGLSLALSVLVLFEADTLPAQEPTPYDAPPPAYTHPWQMVPEVNEDHSQLPPPPGFSYNTSKINASAEDADRAHAWTDANPLWPCRQLSEFDLKSLAVGYSSLLKPVELIGQSNPIRSRPGVTSVVTKPKCGDCCLLSTQPLYSPLQQQSSAYAGASATAAAKAAEAGLFDPNQPKLAYYEVKVLGVERDGGVALGFVAPPHPSWRLPGWERASLGVHGDDGRRFVNDTWGGRSFTKPFRNGETLGLGMEFPPASAAPPSYGHNYGSSGTSEKSAAASSGYADVKVFLTRNGDRVADWDLHEPVDAEMDQPGGVTGLEGTHDLHAAVGVYGAAKFEVIFGRHNWLYRPNGK